MSDEIAAELGEATRASLIAPAGHGKTWTLVRAVAHAPARQLVLTHTHAGVQAIRRHLHGAGVPPQDYDVDTIAGFATRWAAAYPQTGGWDATAAEPDWDALHPAAIRVLGRPQLLASVQRSYRGVLVDEYQDCTVDQHRLILTLAEVLPTRVVGDPLQGVYTFGNALPVDFETDVYPHFPPLDPLTTPWRWIANEALADDLQRLRAQLRDEVRPDWGDYPSIAVERDSPGSIVALCTRVGELGGTAAVLRQHGPQAHATAGRLRGRFVSMEEQEGHAVLKAGAQLEGEVGPARAAVVLDILEMCTTKVVPDLRSQRRRYKDGELPKVPKGQKAALVSALNDVATDEDLAAVAAAIEVARNHPGVVVYRPEILDNLAAAARRCARSDEDASLTSEVKALRDRQRRSGRVLPDRVVSRTLLVKGLEFDHTIVCDSSALDSRQLYVAVTRAAKTVTVVAYSPEGRALVDRCSVVVLWCLTSGRSRRS